jgi:hypothetical protein
MASNQEIIDDLKAKVATLKQAEADRETRDEAEEAATAAQIALLEQQIVDLKAIIDAGGLTAQQQADLADVSAAIQATVDSLNAADPTPPVVP